jgi:hypothetical protein
LPEVWNLNHVLTALVCRVHAAVLSAGAGDRAAEGQDGSRQVDKMLSAKVWLETCERILPGLEVFFVFPLNRGYARKLIR